MIDEVPLIQTQPFNRPAPSLVDALRQTPTGFLADAMGGSGALDYRIKPAIAHQYAFCGVALTCHAGPADNLALVHALQHIQPGDVLMVGTDCLADGTRPRAKAGDRVEVSAPGLSSVITHVKGLA